jgi:mlo protein
MIFQSSVANINSFSSCIFQWLKKTHQNPLYKAMEKMKEGTQYVLRSIFFYFILFGCCEKWTNALLPSALEMMLLGFISLLLAATSRIISGICIYSKYNSKFSPCTKAEVEESLSTEHAVVRKGKRLMEVIVQHSLRRNLEASYRHLEGCREVCLYYFFLGSLENFSSSLNCLQ